jgi:hypothetical protein
MAARWLYPGNAIFYNTSQNSVLAVLQSIKVRRRNTGPHKEHNMPPIRLYRLNPDVVDADQEALMAVQKLHDYAPFNPAHKVDALVAMKQRIEQARQNEIHARKALVALRDEIIAAEWELHDAMLCVKAHVVAQYGLDSDAIQAVGLKKRSKRRRSSRGKNPSEAQPAS